MRNYMARLGQFQFSIDTAAFEQLQRQASFRWQSKERIGRKPAQQFTGPGSDTITLSGIIYPHYRGGITQIGQMRAMAGRGQPLALVYAFERLGQYCGRWCITEISETRRVLFNDGRPRKIEFSLSLTEYGEDWGDTVSAMSAAVSAVASSGPTGLAGALSGVLDLAKNVSASAGVIGDILADQMDTVVTLGATLGVDYSKVSGAISKGMKTARKVKGAGDAATILAGTTPSAGSIAKAADTVSADAGSNAGAAASASRDLDDAYSANSATSSDGLKTALRTAQRAMGSLSKLVTDSAVKANKIKRSVE